ncbi:hypothetical protein [Vulgatibacter incomptus]|uniref:Uncharacterized protein n=1 Tax=Vulgatibacter incomptus TaxID=1391653 RepID=A0A0K1PF61_9BACT|nr:hypothetical protein [Vulgatibacter incomptus]AKU92061.1 hypothetical protein AKJ08_2448 [Vulgatibacter incomptus]
MNDGSGEQDERIPEAPADPVTEARAGLSPTDKVCGNCLIWRPNRQEASGRWVGPCRLMPGRGDLAPTSASCERFLPRGSRIPSAPPPDPTRRRSRTIAGPTIRKAGGASVNLFRASRPAEPDVELGDLLDMTRNELIEIIRDALGEGDAPPLANKWEGGSIVLKPASSELQEREIPIDSLLRKVVMIRDRLRVLEAKLNASAKLTDGEKVEFQSYITKCYGSLTTFNLLFRDKEDQFVGEKGKDT